jgi:formylglycine-generating enzyme required for sulfatase activity
MSALPLECVTRVYATDGVIGAGFLVGQRLVLTCAHVVAEAVGESTDLQVAPTTEITLDFPLIDGAPRASATVRRWRPRGAPGGDLALLELTDDAPPTVAAARLMGSSDTWGHPFRVFGFADPNGAYAVGEIRDRQADGWIQIDVTRDTGHAVIGGYSGTPAFDDLLGGFVGMVVESDEDPQLRTARLVPTEVLLDFVPELQRQSIAAPPYRSLRAFTRDDSDIFKGRARFVRERLLPAVRNKAMVAVVIGSSGCGKSSVVFAGLMPELNKDPDWVIGSFRPGQAPFDAVASQLEDWLEPDASEATRIVETRKLGLALLQGDATIADVIERLDAKARGSALHYLLVVDQFEEVFNRCPDPETQKAFLAAIAGAVTAERQRDTPRLTVLITMRSDFMRQVLAHGTFAQVLEGSIEPLGAMTRQELADAVRLPAESRGVQLQPGLVERIIDDVGEEAGRLPLMQFALTLLWAEQEGGWLTHAAYDGIGGVDQALANYAQAIIDGLSEERREDVRRLFIQLVLTDANGNVSRRVATRDELGPTLWTLAQQLSYQRLVVIGRNELSEVETVELIHHTLLTHWKTLSDWADDARAFRDWQDRTRTAAMAWIASGRDDGGLLRGSFLARAEDWRNERDQDLGPLERELIDASITFRDADAVALEERRQNQLRTQRRVARLTGLVAVVFAVAAIASYGFVTTRAGFDISAYVVGSGNALADNPLVPEPAATITFGTDESEGGGEARTQSAAVAAFEIQKAEVTNGQFRLCRRALACSSDPIIRTYFEDSRNDRLPVVYVDAFQATEYCAWLGGRLPDSYEWERAARGADGRAWPWGDAPPTPEQANLDPSKGLTDASAHPSGASREGVVDLIGNAWEWTRTTGSPGSPSAATPLWDGTTRNVTLVQRGGSWGFLMSRVTEVQTADPQEFNKYLGFRCVTSPR